MKKVLISLALASTFASSLLAEESGFLVGVSAGGAISINAMNGSNSSGSTTIFLGAKGGYQGFFTEAHGVRFYGSALVAYGFYPAAVNNAAGTTATTQTIPLAHDMYALIDVNADYLFNWTNASDYTAGLYAGFFTGALIGVPLTNSTGATSVGSTLGLNLGIRSSINTNHQVEFGIKCGLAFFSRSQPSSNNLGTLIGLQTSYIYKF